MRIFPSIAALAVGRVLGALYESIPLRCGRLKLSYLFTLPTAPLAILLYTWQKLFGPRFVLTSRRIGQQRGLSSQWEKFVPLDEIGRVEIQVSFGQKFYKAGSLVVRDHVGNERLVMRGIVRADMFRRTILEARDAVVKTESAMQQIDRRANASIV